MEEPQATIRASASVRSTITITGNRDRRGVSQAASAVDESGQGTKLHVMRRSDMSAIGGEAEMIGVRSKRR
jgi:hypothetical protein